MEGNITLDWVGTDGFFGPTASGDVFSSSEELHNYADVIGQVQQPEIRQSEEVRNYAEKVAARRVQPEAIFLSDLKAEQDLKEKTAGLLGRVGVAEASSLADTTVTLKEAAQRAKRGDREAWDLVKTNVGTDYMERTYKTKNVIRVVLTTDENGKLMQHGQTMEDVNINTLEHLKSDALKKRGKIEAHNAVRQQYCYERGMLKDNAILTWSTVFDEITRKEAEDLGYFTENMSCAAQLLTEENDEVVLYSAFVAGADSTDGERFDFDAIVAASAEFALDYTGMSSNEILAQPGLISKDLLPDLILTAVEKYDNHTPGPHKRFFGRIHQGERDYRGHMLECQRRERQAAHHVDQVARELIESSDTFICATDATTLLDALNDKVLKKNIVYDTTIESNVLGITAQQFVEEARLYAESGNQEAAERAQAKVEQYGKSSSCPKDPSSKTEASNSDTELQADRNNSDSKKRWMSCPFCKKSKAVYADVCANKLECRHCSACVENGKVVSTGNSAKPKAQNDTKKDAGAEQLEREIALEAQVNEAFKEKGVESFEAEQQKVNAQQVGQLALAG